ncbi:zinc finger BED domain-containing protein RICESLEEPER 2-like protein, partial [Tanacetum coccineum]
MCLTAHWIDEKWNLKKKILNFCQIANHKGVTIEKCCAHIINLVVRDGLEEHIDSVDKIRNAVRYLRSSPGRLTSFEESVEFEKIDCGRKPCLDVDTRWNSTFLMLEMALKFRSAFE